MILNVCMCFLAVCTYNNLPSYNNSRRLVQYKSIEIPHIDAELAIKKPLGRAVLVYEYPVSMRWF